MKEEIIGYLREQESHLEDQYQDEEIYEELKKVRKFIKYLEKTK